MRGGRVFARGVAAGFVAFVGAGTTSVEAACSVSPAGQVDCAQNTTTDPTTDVNGVNANSNSRTELFNNGNPIAAEIAPGVTVDGAGLALVENGKRGGPRPLTLTDDGSVLAHDSTQGGLYLSGSGGAMTYGGTGSVTNVTGPAIFARNSGNITLTIDGAVTGGSPGAVVHGLTPTPPGIEADGIGRGNVVIGGSGTVTAPGGRGLIAEEKKTGRGSVLVTGSGDVAGQGRICPGVDYDRGLRVGKVGCSGIRALIANRMNASNVTVNRSGNIAGTSTAINAITYGRGNVAITTGPAAQIVGAFEFGIEAMGQGNRSTGSIVVTTGASGTITSGGDGIFAANFADQIPGGAKSTIVIHSAGQITSGSFPAAARNSKNPSRTLAGISAGYIGGRSATPNAAVYGNVSIENAASITAQTGDGILGYNFGAGLLSIGTGASVTAQAGDGISTIATTGATRIAVTGAGTTVQGSGAGQAALTGRSTGGEIDVEVGSGATLRGVDGAVGFDMESTLSAKSISNFGTIIGGLPQNGNPPASAKYGVGIVGANLTLLNDGAVIGGSTNGGGANQSYAILFTGGANSIGGSGTIAGGVDVAASSSFMPALPDSAVGTPLATGGPLRFASDAAYRIRLTPSASDSAVVTGVASLHGATLSVDAIGAAPSKGTRYTILTATGGVADQFSGVVSNLAFFRPTLAYGATDVVLTSRYDFVVPGGAQNQDALGAALDNAAVLGRTGRPAALVSALQNVPTSQEATALGSLSGEGIAAAQNVGLRSSQLFAAAIFDETTFYAAGGDNSITLTADPPVHELADLPRGAVAPAFEPTRTWRAWGSGFGSVDDIRGDTTVGSASQTDAIYGGVLGVDYQVAPNYLAGVAFGGSEGQFSVPGRSTSGSTTGGHVAFYDVATVGSFYGASSTSFSDYVNRATRTTGGFGGLGNETERASFGSHEFLGRLEVGRHFDEDDGIVTPFLALEVAELRSNGFSENAVSGPGLLALNVNGRSTASAPAFIGARLQRPTALGDGLVWAPTLQVAYVHEFAPQRSQAGALIDLPGSTFLVDGARPGTNYGEVKFGGELTLGSHAFLFANFDGEFSRAIQSYGGQGGGKYFW